MGSVVLHSGCTLYSVSAPLILLPKYSGCFEHWAHYEHILGHKRGARAPSAPWLDPPLYRGDVETLSEFAGILPKLRRIRIKICFKFPASIPYWRFWQLCRKGTMQPTLFQTSVTGRNSRFRDDLLSLRLWERERERERDTHTHTEREREREREYSIKRRVIRHHQRVSVWFINDRIGDIMERTWEAFGHVICHRRICESEIRQLIKHLNILYMWHVKRIRVFEHSVVTNFNCARPTIQRGQGSGFLSEGSFWLTACMSEQRRFRRDCAHAQARLNLRCSHRRLQNSPDAAHMSYSPQQNSRLEDVS